MSTPAIPADFLEITFIHETEQLHFNERNDRILPFADSPVFYSKIHNVSLLTKGEHVKKVFDIALCTKEIDYPYQPGDTIGILPCNDDGEVDEIFKLLDIFQYADEYYKLHISNGTTKKKASLPAHVPKYGTLRNLFSSCLDIRSPPKKLFLRTLSKYTNNEKELEKLNKICTPQGSQDYNKLISESGKTLLMLLQTFPSCKPPVERLIEHLPPLQPRPYSISSSPLLNTELHITISVIQVNEQLKGICSGWLEKKMENFIKNQENCTIPFYFRKPNLFRLPEELETPMIMIGPGTGVAPFIGFLQHLQLKKKESSSLQLGQNVLIFGCRYSDGDFLYKKEIQGFLQQGLLTKLYTSFSREGDKKMYVQDNILKHSNEIGQKIMNENAVVFVCGDAKNMMRDVKNAIISAVAKYSNMPNAEAEDYVNTLQKNYQYIQDTWI